MIGTLEIIIILLGFIVVPLVCWVFCLWMDYSMNYIERACTKANKNHNEWERRKRSKK
jgi:hypothetical protein